MRVGFPGGTSEAFLRGALIPEYERDGIQMGNYVHAWISFQHPYWTFLDPYRWRIEWPSADAGIDSKKGLDVHVVRAACPRELILPRLKAGESIEMWLSPRGVQHIEFGTKRWDYEDGIAIELHANPHTRVGAEYRWSNDMGAFRYTAPRNSAQARFQTMNAHDQSYRARVELLDLTVEVMNVVLANGTRFDRAQVLSTDDFAHMFVRVRVTRR